MKPVVEMLRSKKAIMAITGLVTAVGVRLGLDLPPGEAESLSEIILYFVGTYVIGQGMADFGKHRPTNTDFDGSGQ